MRRILFISYHFPPSPAVGGTRVANFAKAFPAFGFEPVVLTVQEKFIADPDQGRLRGLERTEILRAGRLPMLINLYPFLKRLVFGKAQAAPQVQANPLPWLNTAKRQEKLPQKLRRYLKSFAFLPDGEKNWILPAVAKALALIRAGKIDCIFTSCPPYSAHVVGLILKTLTGVKWVADFRDPWMTVGTKRLYPTCALSLKLDRALERMAIRKADLVLFNTPNLRDAYRERYSSKPGEKFLFVPNGFDGEFFSRFREEKKYDRFTITYAGSLYLGRTPEPVFAALKELIDEGRIKPDEVCVKIFGDSASIGGRPSADVIAGYGLEKVVELCGTVSYLEATRAIAKSRLALLLAMHQPFQIPGKVYDYIGASTKVLAVTDGGAVVDFLRTTGAGEAFSPQDINGIKEFIWSEFKNSSGSGFCAAQELESGHIAGDLAARLKMMLSTDTVEEAGKISLQKKGQV